MIFKVQKLGFFLILINRCGKMGKPFDVTPGDKIKVTNEEGILIFL